MLDAYVDKIPNGIDFVNTDIDFGEIADDNCPPAASESNDAGDDLYRLQPVAIPPSRTSIGVQDRLPIGAQRIDQELPDQQLDDVLYHHVLCRKMDPSQMGLAMRKLRPKPLLKNDGAGSGDM
jgi:hypothetical protein